MGVRVFVIGVALIALAWFVPIAIMSDAFTESIPSLESGNPAPDFTVERVSTGEEVTAEDYRGRVVLLNLWATWCAPCLQEMPAMERIHQKLGNEGLEVVAVSLDATNDGSIGAFAERLGLTFDILYDPTHTIERSYQVTALPQSFVIDRNGIIVSHEFGATVWDDDLHEASFRKLLESPAQSEN